MKKALRHTYALLWLALLWLALPAQGAADGQYTAEHPLVVVSDWEFPPYEFRDNYGRTSGYNIDLLNRILDELKIPHKFVMKEWYQAVETFERREADLIVAAADKYRHPPYVRSHTVVSYFSVKVAYRHDAKPIAALSQLSGNETVVLKNNDYAALKIVNDLYPTLNTEYHSTKDALSGLVSGRYDYFVWGEEPLRWLAKELALTDSITIGSIDVPTAEFHFVGYDQQLMDEIDDQYARLEQAGEVERISDKWLHPEHVHNDESPILLISVFVVLAISVLLFLLNRWTRLRLNKATRRLNDLNSTMEQALSMGDYYVIEYDFLTDRFRNLYRDFIPDGGLSMEQYLEHMEPEEGVTARETWLRIQQGVINDTHTLRKWYAGTPADSEPRYYQVYSTIETDNGGEPRYLISMLCNVTHDMEEQRAEEEMGSKYQWMFETTLIAMSFYDKNGMLMDLNQKMRELCAFDAEGEAFFRRTCMFDIPLFKADFDPKSREHFHVCQRMRYPEVGIDKYIEFRVRPTYSDDELLFYTVTARDVTNERNIYLTQRMHDEQLHKTNKAINHYERQLNYLMEKSDMYVWTSDNERQTVTFARSLHSEGHTETFQEYFEGMVPEGRAEAMRLLNDYMLQGKPFNGIHHFNHTPVDTQPVWYAITGMPLQDADGHAKGHFGVVRDVTAIMDAQQKLKVETERAQDSGAKKSVFLANMTHEIRTPLNAIVGFSDLLQMIDDPAERRDMIRIIRNNCDMLLRLINDILEASTMGSNPVAINPTNIDFAQAFNDICQTLAGRVTEPGVQFITENPFDTFPTRLDKGRIQQVITNFVTNAVKYTHEGHIKVGYRPTPNPSLVGRGGDSSTAGMGVQGNTSPPNKGGEGGGSAGLLVYCEDTGAGIPKEKQASVFERFVKLNDFVQGTGLGLAICKSIAERCGGSIGVDSEGPGHGSTFWLWVPCEKLETTTP